MSPEATRPGSRFPSGSIIARSPVISTPWRRPVCGRAAGCAARCDVRPAVRVLSESTANVAPLPVACPSRVRDRGGTPVANEAILEVVHRPRTPFPETPTLGRRSRSTQAPRAAPAPLSQIRRACAAGRLRAWSRPLPRRRGYHGGSPSPLASRAASSSGGFSDCTLRLAGAVPLRDLFAMLLRGIEVSFGTRSRRRFSLLTFRVFTGACRALGYSSGPEFGHSRMRVDVRPSATGASSYSWVLGA